MRPLLFSAAVLAISAAAAINVQPVGAAPESALPPALVQAISRDLHLSPADYLARASAAQKLGAYARDFRSRQPKAFAGAWIAPDGKPVIAVTSEDAAGAAARDGYRTHRAPISAEGLETSQSQLNDWVTKLPRDISSQINSVVIDVLNSQLVVNIANSPIARALNFPTLLANLKVVLSPGGAPAADRRTMGGDTFITAAGPLAQTPRDAIRVCSFGFNAVDRANNALNITAGHCDPNVNGRGEKASVYTPNLADIPASPQLGIFVRSALGDAAGLDYALIGLNERAVRAGLDQPTVRGAGGTTLTLTGIGQPVVGAPVCKTGQSSAFTCGYIAAAQVASVLGSSDGSVHLVRGFASTACTLPGDSGGATVSGTLAVGITSGSNLSHMIPCEAANLALAAVGGTYSVNIPVQAILNEIDAKSGGGIGKGIRLRTR